MRAINWRISLGSGRCPPRDFQRQNSLKLFRVPADESRWRHDGERFFPVKEPRPEHRRQPRPIGQSARPGLVILVVCELLSQEQDFRRYCCPAMGDDVHELQSIPEQFPDDEDGAHVASPGDLKSKHGSFSFAQNGKGFFTNGRKLLEFEPALIHFANCRGFCGAQTEPFFPSPHPTPALIDLLSERA
jgi:hypothetical protein